MTTLTSTSSDEISDELSSGTIQKKKNRKTSTTRNEMKKKDKNTVTKENDETSKERKGNLNIHKNRYYHQPKAPVGRIQSTFSSAITRKRQIIVLFNDSILKNLGMGEFSIPMSRQKSRIFHVNLLLRHYGGQLETTVEQEAGKKIDCKK